MEGKRRTGRQEQGSKGVRVVGWGYPYEDLSPKCYICFFLSQCFLVFGFCLVSFVSPSLAGRVVEI